MRKIQNKGCLTFIPFFLMLSAFLCWGIFSFIKSCNTGFGYKAGNLVLLGYTIDTKLSYDIRKQYLDIMANSQEFSVPQKWREYDKLYEINPESTWRIYFKKL